MKGSDFSRALDKSEINRPEPSLLGLAHKKIPKSRFPLWESPLCSTTSQEQEVILQASTLPRLFRSRHLEDY